MPGGKLANFSRRFSRRSEGSYFPSQQEVKKDTAPVSGATHSHHSSWENAPRDSGNPSGASDGLSSDPPSSVSALSPQYQLRPPMTHRRFSSLHASSTNFRLPDLPWLCGTWHVTHSTLPMWKNKRNVRIAYTRLPGNKLDDYVTYQNMSSKDIHTVHGIDTPKKDGSYLWRGKGLLRVASSKWELLGWGGGGSHAAAPFPAGTQTVEIDNPNTAVNEGDDAEQWVITYFAKTPFTPAGIDIYSRKSTGLSAATLQKLRLALVQLDGRHRQEDKPRNDLGQLVGRIFEVRTDDGRADLRE